MRSWMGLVTLVCLTWVSTAIAAEGPLVDRAHSFPRRVQVRPESLIEEAAGIMSTFASGLKPFPTARPESLKQMTSQQRGNLRRLAEDPGPRSRCRRSLCPHLP
ncbi:MAG: hypothetical protein U0894_09790 [Pirellulales bacterium]